MIITGFMCYNPTYLEGLEDLLALRDLKLMNCRILSGWPDLSRSKELENINLDRCEVEMQEDDIHMLASLPLLQPLLVNTFVQLDLVQRKVLRYTDLNFFSRLLLERVCSYPSAQV